MIFLYITLLFFTLLLAIVARRGFILYNSLLLLYCLSFVSTIILDHLNPQNDIKFIPSLYLVIILLLWIFPFFSIKKYVYNSSIKDRREKIILVIRTLGTISTLGLVYFIFYTLKLFITVDLTSARDLIYKESILPMGFVSLFFISFSTIYHIYIYFFFLSIVEGFSKKDIVLMFLSSLTFPAMVLCYFGRDGVLYWVINFLIMYLYFSSAMSVDLRKKINRLSILIITSFIALFLVITISRFKESSGGSLGSLVSYAGQQFQNFSKLFYINGQGSPLFPTFDTLMQKIGIIPIVDKEVFTFYEKLLLSDNYNVFSFFVGSFFLKIGFFLTILLSFFSFFFILKIKSHYNKNKNIYDFIIIYSFFQIPMCGVFYYRQGVSYMDIGFIYIFLIYVFIRYKFTISHNSNN